MSYPRNAASPEPIAIGPVVKISDGVVQTSGCTVRIKPNGVAEGDGAGTTSYSTDGVVLYTPTQGETNYTSFILIAKKTDCIPANITIVTSAQSVPGLVALETATQASIDAIEGDVAGLDGEAMRGTDGANTTAPDNTQGAAVITALGDGTVVLHPNYDAAKNAASQYTADADHDLTQAVIDALNFATPTNVTDAQTAIIAQIDANETKIDTLTANLATVDTVVDGIQTDLSNAADGLGALKTLIDALPSRSSITGGNYALDTDANGRIRIVDGTGAGELDTLSGTVLLRSATQTSIDAIEADTDELQGDWVNGGRLDLLIDAIKAKTDQMTYSVANKLDSNPTPTAAICDKIADHVRRRTQANVEASSDGDTLDLSSLYGFIQQAQESSISGTTLTVNKTDGTTSLGTKTLTSNASADPVTGIA